MKAKLMIFAMVIALVATVVVAPLSAEAQSNTATHAVTTPVTGTFAGGTFHGRYTITRFVNRNGTLYAVGTLSGTLTNTAGKVIGTVSSVPVRLPVTNATATCPILTLKLGPLHLNLLGLVVNLNRVNLRITAQPGSGALLGNLLCTVANLLNGGAPLGSLANLLNQILAAL